MIYLVDATTQTDSDLAELAGSTALVTFDLRVRGVVDLNEYGSGGTIVQKYVMKGGAPVASNRTVVKLETSLPVQTYFLNVCPTLVIPDYNVPLDYALRLIVQANSNIILTIDNIDDKQFRGDVNGVLIDQEPLGLYNGIWVQVDTEPSEPLTTYSVTTGGGVRGWRWSAFAENVYGIKADK